MSSLMQLLTEQLGGDTIGQMSRQLGTDEQTTQNAIGAALPTLLGAMSRNASQPGGAEALHGALEKDHDGSLLDNFSGLLGGGGEGLQQEEAQGEAILGHVLGEKRQRVESGISQVSGLDSGATGKLMSMLAPMLMGAVGKQQRSQGMDASALAGFLGQEQQEMEQGAPEQAGLMGKLLDQDGDGDFDASDMLKMGAGLFGRMLKR